MDFFPIHAFKEYLVKNFMIAQRDSNRSGLIASTLAVVAFSFASPAQARDNASLSISINVPGAVYPSYAYPVYTQPPVYVPSPAKQPSATTSAASDVEQTCATHAAPRHRARHMRA